MNIPAGTQSDKRMRLKAKGIQRLGSYGKGDQIISIVVETPTKLSSEQKEIFEKLADIEHKNVTNPMAKGFFDKVKTIFQ
jgi:molecular chaperone DnaJ